MRIIIKSLIGFLGILILTSFIKKDCSVLRDNHFTYRNANKEVLVIFKGNEYVEYHNNKEHFIKAEIQWISNCEYNLTIIETNLPRFPFKIRSKLRIVVTKVRGNKIYYKSTLGGKTWEGKLTKKKKPR
jgi:hypothetical protein